MSTHKTLLDKTDLDPHFILEIQLGEEEEARMGIPDELVTGYRAKHPGLFPEGEDLAATEAKAQDTRPSKKRRR
jgi:hypothetical protein